MKFKSGRMLAHRLRVKRLDDLREQEERLFDNGDREEMYSYVLPVRSADSDA